MKFDQKAKYHTLTKDKIVFFCLVLFNSLSDYNTLLTLLFDQRGQEKAMKNREKVTMKEELL